MTRGFYGEGVTNEAIRERLAAGGGVIRARRAECSGLVRACARGELARLLPGVYCEPGLAREVETRVRALYLLDPDAVLLGRAAARATWWPELPVPEVAASRRSHARPPSGFHWTDRAIPLDRTVDLPGGIRATDPALTVLDLVPELGGVAIDEALRRGASTLTELARALDEGPGRVGNVLCRRLLRDSRDEPWSEAERAFHRLLRRAALPWRYATNLPVHLPDATYVLDAALPRLRLGFEVDGRQHHGAATAFVADRRRDVRLGLAGWAIHRFAAATVSDEPDWVIAALRVLSNARAVDLGLRCRARVA